MIEPEPSSTNRTASVSFRLAALSWVNLGNSLWEPCGVLFGDWDEVSIVPREIDLINTHQYVRFQVLGQAGLEEFSRAYGWDVRGWHGYDTLRSMGDLHTLGS
ncbi:hypothetical protein ACIP5Y_07250 [Nocardia sp. NPDC088792]|uniref:hypothetical protein n=1 Tax=Nocardia sp. NPDC088792 TaxID=3364332 RepID=UPI00381A7A6D